MRTHVSLSAYIEEITGEPPTTLPLTQGEDAPLPLFLRTLYELKRAEFFGRSLLLAFQKDQIEQPTPSEYANHARKISQIMSAETILVLPKLASYSRNRLVRQGVPFVVPGRQLFLPTLLIDLRERFHRVSRKDSAALSAPSQVLVIFYLLGNSVEGVSLRELAGKLAGNTKEILNEAMVDFGHGLGDRAWAGLRARLAIFSLSIGGSGPGHLPSRTGRMG